MISPPQARCIECRCWGYVDEMLPARFYTAKYLTTRYLHPRCGGAAHSDYLDGVVERLKTVIL